MTEAAVPTARKNIYRFLLTVGVIWALLVIAPDLSRLYRPLSKLSFTSDNSGLIIYIDPDGPAAKAQIELLDRPLAVGDQIDIAKAPCRLPLSEGCRSFLAVFGGMGGLTYVEPGTAVRLPIIGRPDDNAGFGEFSVTAAPDSPDAGLSTYLWWIFLLLDEIAGILIVLESFRLAWRTPNRLRCSFFLYAMWFNPGQYFAFYAWLQQYPVFMLTQEILQSLAVGAGYAGFLTFGLRFPNDRTEPGFTWMLRLPVPVGILLTSLQLCSFLNVFGWYTESVTRLAMLGGYALNLVVVAIVLARTDKQSPRDFQRMRWVVWSCSIGLPAFILADSYEATTLWTRYVFNWSYWQGWSPPEWVPELGYLVSGVLSLGICAALRRQRVVNVNYALRAGARVVLILILAGAGEKTLELLVDLGKEWMTSPESASAQADVDFPAWVQIAVFLLGVWVAERISHSTEHFLDRGREQMAERLRELAAEIGEADDLETVDRLLVEGPARHMRLTSAAMFRDIHGVFRLCKPAFGWDECGRTEFSAAEDLAAIAQLPRQKPLGLRASALSLKGLPDGSAQPTLVLPITIGRDVRAFALYGPHETGDELDAQERMLLQELGNSGKAGYEHAYVLALPLPLNIGGREQRDDEAQTVAGRT